MKLTQLVYALTLTVVLSSCSTLPESTINVDVVSSNLRQHNLYLTYLTATVDNNLLTINGGIRTRTAPTYVAPGFIEIEVYSTEHVLLKTLATLYSPNILHYRPKARRTGYFSATATGVEPQPLLVKVFYRKKCKTFTIAVCSYGEISSGEMQF